MGRIIFRIVLGLLALVAVVVIGFFVFAPAVLDHRMNPVVEHEPYPVTEEALVLHESIPVADLHADSLLWNRDLLKRNGRGHVDFPRMREGGQFLQVFTAVTKTPRGQNYEENSAEAADDIALLAKAQRWPRSTWDSRTERAIYQAEKLAAFAERDRHFQIVLTGEALRTEWIETVMSRRGTRALRDSLPDSGADIEVTDLAALDDAREADALPASIVGILGTEGSHALDGDIANVDRLFAAGYRVMGLQHFFDNDLGGSLHGTSGAGLSAFGREAVLRMADLSIIIDVAHSSEAVVRDVLALNVGSLIVSHTGFNGHCESPRNISDETMAMITEAGGLIGVGFWEDVTCDASPAGIADAIIYGIDTFGADHIALGSDFDGTVTTELDASELPAITQALLDRGVPEEDIRKVMGGNTYRFFAKNLPKD